MNKFNIGDTVHCFRNNYNPFDFIGVVTSFVEVDEGVFEYCVTNAPELITYIGFLHEFSIRDSEFPERQVKSSGFPILIWESEMELA